MRLWVKITAICTAVLFFIMSSSFFVILRLQENTLRRAEEDSTRKSLVMYCTNIITASSTYGIDLRQSTLRSVVQYYFAEYASLVQTDEVFYSLVSEGAYLFDRSPYDPYEVLPSVQNEEMTVMPGEFH